MNEIWIETTRGTIYGMQAGNENAPLILGIHGWSQRNGWHTWEPLIEPLANAGYRVVSVDMPGWGKSPAWEKTAGKSAVVAILDALGVQTAKALMGKSWGGGVAVDFANTYPERVEALLLTAPAVRGGTEIFGRLTQPVLLAWAEDDPMIPVAHGQELADALTTCTLIRYPTGGHSAAPKNAVDFFIEALAFLDVHSNDPDVIKRREFLQACWFNINLCMQEHWIENLIREAKQDPDGPFADVGPAVERLLALGASRRDLSLIYRASSYDAVFSTLYGLEHHDVQHEYGLYENLISSDPSGLEGSPGSAPEKE